VRRSRALALRRADLILTARRADRLRGVASRADRAITGAPADRTLTEHPAP
jgi:short-subunit dehydrogenase